MIKAGHNFIIYNFFRLYSLFIIKRNFNRVNISGGFADRGRPVLLIMNHTSWWDGFWASYLNEKFFKRKFHFMMLEERLNEFRYFRKAGGFSIRKKSRSAIESIGYSAGLLADKNNLLLLFPQGKIRSAHDGDIRFEKGIGRIIEKIPNSIHLMFSVSFTDYLSDRKPNLFIYLKEYGGSNYDSSSIENEYRVFYSQSLNSQKSAADI